VASRLTLNPPLKRHFGLADQIRRAAAAIPANIAAFAHIWNWFGTSTWLPRGLLVTRWHSATGSSGY